MDRIFCKILTPVPRFRHLRHSAAQSGTNVQNSSRPFPKRSRGKRYRNGRAAASAFLLFATSSIAYADAIDGYWCSDDGKQMSISGPDITTPGGSRIKGNYDRHGFDYVVPDGEAGNGEKVTILLRSEYLAVSRQGAGDAPTKEWRRCPERTS